MTTEVIIKNKTCIVMAADSAVTVTAGVTPRKVYNSANKLFSLSKHKPVGILVYNNAAINEIPIEIIIKECRARLAKIELNDISAYAKHFKDTIKDFVSKHITVETKKDRLSHYFNEFINYLSEIMRTTKGVNFDDLLQNQSDGIKDVILKNNINPIQGRKVYPYIKNNSRINDLFEAFCKRENIKVSFDRICDIFVLYINIIDDFTGVAIGGYGAKDIYPDVAYFKTRGFIGDELVIYGEENSGYGNEIIPLAQRDMIDTFICGVSNQVLFQFKKLLISSVGQSLDAVRPILALNDTAYKIMKETILSDVDHNFNGRDYIDNTQAFQIVRALDNLSKEEMAELAENLVNLQILKYKVSTNLETVGGPIDVAIISKYDGFVWKKRKLYFPADLNFHFFENYFKK